MSDRHRQQRRVCVCLLLLCAQESIQNRYKINFHYNPSQMVIFVQLQMIDHVQLLIYSVGLAVWQLGWVDLDLECSTILGSR